MKVFHFLNQHLESWRQRPSQTAGNKASGISSSLPGWGQLQRIHPPLMLAVTVTALTSVVGYRFYNQPRLAVGTVSPTTIAAPEDGSFVDLKTTEDKRKEAQTAIVPIWQRDEEATGEIEAAVGEAIGEIESLRRLRRPLPWFAPQLLSSGTQQYLRTCSEADWQDILAAVKPPLTSLPPAPRPKDSPKQRAIAELNRYRQGQPAAWQSLLAQIDRVRQSQRQALGKVPDLPQAVPPEAISTLLNLPPRQWQATQQSLKQATRQILAQGIPPGMPASLLKESVLLHLYPDLPPPAQAGATALFLSLLQDRTNLTVDPEATKQRARQAAEAVQPAIVEIKRGETIVKGGETITQANFVLLDGFGLSRRGTNWFGLGAAAFFVTSGVGIFCWVKRRVHRRLRRRDQILLCLLSLSAPLIATTDLYYLNLPAVGLLSSSFYGPALAVTQVAILTGLSAFAAESLSWEYVLAVGAGGLLAAAIAGRLHSRDGLALLGVGAGLAQGSVYFVVQLVLSGAAGTVALPLLPGVAVYGLLGVAWSVVALGISPYLERLFDVTTPIRLAELANPNCPLLKRLATEAPGTFQHTVSVACLAEAAARELHCNVELIRAGTLYHDIGKMHDPLGFIENQMGEPNKHDAIDDPWQSAQIIKKHVTEGLVMARRYGLPRVVRDFIPEHQGTLLISYFYYQAKQQAEAQGGGTVAEADFRYDGPIPQSRETGLVMLADGCEAALRSLRGATPQLARTTVQKVLRARWQEGQLQDSGIKYEELPAIADVFVQIWQRFNHQRIAYPKAALEPQEQQRTGDGS